MKIPRIVWIIFALAPFLMGQERIAVPWEIWIFLMVISGGLYGVVIIIRKVTYTIQEHRYLEQQNKQQQRVNQISQVYAELMTALLESKTEELQQILSKHDVAADKRDGFIAVAVVVLQEIVQAQERKEKSLDGVRSRLQTNGLSSAFADILIQAASKALGRTA
jgi:hypothetical protein